MRGGRGRLLLEEDKKDDALGGAGELLGRWIILRFQRWFYFLQGSGLFFIIISRRWIWSLVAFFFFILEAVQLWRDVKFHAPFGLRTRHDLRGACTLQSAE